MPEGISPLDVVLALPLLWGAIRGVRKGFILELTGLAALFFGAYAALFGSDVAAAWLDSEFAIGKSYLGIMAFAVTFIAVAIGVHLLGRVIEKLVDITALKPLDRLGGLIFALGKTWLFWSIVVLLLQGTLGVDFLPQAWREDSHLWPALDQSARFILPLIDPWIPKI